MKILLFKLSSLGDLLHVFPALTELYKTVPALEITWVVEESFKEVPLWHPAVKQVIAAPLRQLKKERFFIKISGIFKLIRQIRKQKYDAVIDAQGLFKSALLAKFARTKNIIGFGKGSARESVSWLYNQCMDASWNWHAITRLEKLFNGFIPNHIDIAQSDIDYQLRPWQPPDTKILFFAHGTTWSSKHYPDLLWQQLVKIATDAGYQVWLPFVNDRELQRAEYLKINNQVKILPRMSITAIKDKLYEVSGVIAVDTGLAHIAAALGVPTATLYGPTDPTKIGTIGRHQIHLSAQFICAPCEKKQCFHPEHAIPPCPPCFRTLLPAEVFACLKNLLGFIDHK